MATPGQKHVSRVPLTGQMLLDAAREMHAREYHSLSQSAVAEAIMSAWSEHKATKSTMKRNPDECLERIRSIIVTVLEKDIRGRPETKLTLHADVSGYAVAGKPADQVITVSASNAVMTLLHYPEKITADLGESELVFLNKNNIDDDNDDDDGNQDEVAEDSYGSDDSMGPFQDRVPSPPDYMVNR